MRYRKPWVLSAVLVFFPSLAQQAQRSFPLKRFEVIRVDPDDMLRLPPSVRLIFSSPVPDGEPVVSLDEATKRAGFAPRLLKSPSVSRFVVIDSVNSEIKIDLSELTAAMREAKIRDVRVPQQWNGAMIHLHQDPGILTDYGDFFVAQGPPFTMNTSPEFPLDRLMEILLRIAGIDTTQAHMLCQDFSTNPASFFPIPTRYEMDNRHVRLAAGSGLLLQNAEKGGELVLMWSDGERSYFLSGLLTEAQAIATANALQ
jgi:hypothetical protein